MQSFGRLKELNAATEGRPWLLRAGNWHIAGLIAQTTILGYVAMTAKDLLNGRTRRKLVTEEGGLNWEVFMASAARGGGLGIYGDFLFAEYDRRYKSFLGAVAGPALGQLDPFAALLSKARRKTLDPDSGESLGFDLLRFAQDNTPMASLFYVRPILEHFIMWHLREGLSPGILRRTQQQIGRNHDQEFWIDPVLY